MSRNPASTERDAGSVGPDSLPFARDAASFDQAADVYERARPSYPVEAVEWLVPPGARTVLDLGAGTGKFTRLLAAERIIAVDPSERMLDQLRAAVPRADARLGSAEHIPVDDGSIDTVVAAQAWHWVDQERATAEVARVLRPGGTLGLIWNIRDERVGWVADLSRVIHYSEAERALRDEVLIGPPFGPTETFAIEWNRTSSPESLLALVESRSYLITATPERRAEVLDGVRDLIAKHPDLAGKGSFELPYRTHCFRATLR